MCDGFWVVLVAPSPKFQLHAVTGPLDWSVNCTVKGAWPELGLAEKFAVTGVGPGALVTVMVWLALLVCPPLLATVNVAVKLPAAL